MINELSILLKKTTQKLYQHFLSLRERIPRVVTTFGGFLFLSIICFAMFISLRPEVDGNIFFSSDDPQFQSEHLIDELFVRQDSQLIIAAEWDIIYATYRENVHDLSEALLALKGVASVNSLTHAGPNSLREALDSPLWRRLIMSNDKKSTNFIVFLNEQTIPETVVQIENLMASFESDTFHLRAAGLPYVVELIKRNLMHDLKVFSLLACLIFGLIIFFIFRSKGVLIGAMISCVSACVWTFMVTYLMNVPMGIMTANLGTIIFIMTLSHIIFLTFNWRTFRADSKCEDPVQAAISRTIVPSFWGMFTTLLGFLSLSMVAAKPLRDLGASGAVGAIVAIIVAYGVFPSFLKLASIPLGKKKSTVEEYQKKTYKFIDLEKQFVMLIIFVTCLLTLPGLSMINSDPSLISYFSESSEIYNGFTYIDQNGGSSPLLLVVRASDGGKIHSDRSYVKLWKLQESLEQHRGVGSVISLPVLIAQAHKEAPFGWFLPRQLLLLAMELPSNDEVAKGFITKDRMHGLFMLRMIESYRTSSRLEIIDEIKDITQTEGFDLEIIGGVYSLQGHLAKLVFSSLIGGLLMLILLFAIIIFIISRSWEITVAVAASIFIIPLTVLGCFGIYRIPLDIISAPASNVAIAMGIDSMIHMVLAFKRTKNWDVVRCELWQPILTSMTVVGLGFSIFLFSNFPPTQRFGGAIVLGTILSGLTALYILPLCYQYIQSKMKK